MTKEILELSMYFGDDGGSTPMSSFCPESAPARLTVP